MKPNPNTNPNATLTLTLILTLITVSTPRSVADDVNAVVCTELLRVSDTLNNGLVRGA